MTITEIVRSSLGQFLGTPLQPADDGRTLSDLGVASGQTNQVVAALATGFAPDRIASLGDFLMVSMTVRQVIDLCTRFLDVNEFDRTMDVISAMFGGPPPTSTKLSALGVTSANEGLLIRRLQREFSLYRLLRLDLKASDISGDTTIFDLIRHIESHLIRR